MPISRINFVFFGFPKIRHHCSQFLLAVIYLVCCVIQLGPSTYFLYGSLICCWFLFFLSFFLSFLSCLSCLSCLSFFPSFLYLLLLCLFCFCLFQFPAIEGYRTSRRSLSTQNVHLSVWWPMRPVKGLQDGWCKLYNYWPYCDFGAISHTIDFLSLFALYTIWLVLLEGFWISMKS